MRLSFDFHIHLSPGLSNLIERFLGMNERLRTALEGLTAEVADSNTKLASIQAFVEGVPQLVAEAVADALESADVEADQAADLIDEARTTVSDRVDSVLAAVSANTPPEPGGEDTTTAPTEPETPAGGDGTDAPAA